jgi:alpha-amylase
MKNPLFTGLLKQMSRQYGKIVLCFRYILSIFITLAVWSGSASADVILHAFNWPYKTITERANEIADIGQ